MTDDAEPAAPPVTVSEATEVTDELVEAFVRLIPQLSSSSAPTSRDELDGDRRLGGDHRCSWPGTATGGIVGSLTLAVFRIPTGVRAWIEDVVVDDVRPGPGRGEALVAAAVARAGSAGAKTVDLTSRPSREAANRLYVRHRVRAPDDERVPGRTLDGRRPGSRSRPADAGVGGLMAGGGLRRSPDRLGPVPSPPARARVDGPAAPRSPGRESHVLW